jgi:hypothetical protein
MKKNNFILFALMIIFALEQAHAQKGLSYKPLKSFEKDTIQYLEYNFNKRSSQYIGKTVADFINVLELSIIYLDKFKIEQKWSPSKRFINRMNLGIVMVNSKPDDKVDYYITIEIKNGVDSEEFYRAAKFDKHEVIHWTDKLYEVLKNFEIIDIGTNPKLVKKKKK